MWNARLDEAQAGIKIARRNINKLRYADDAMLMSQNEEELKSLLMKVKEESKNADFWDGRWEGGSGLATLVHRWLIHVNVWQNQYSIVKQNKVKSKNKNKMLT